MRLNRMSLQKRKNLAGYLFVAPWLLGVIIFVLYPFYQTIMLSFHQVLMFPTGMHLEFVGFQNFRDIWVRDIFFVTRLATLFVEFLIRVPIIVIIALILAILVNQKIKLQGLFRVLFFLPVIITSGPVINELSSGDSTALTLLDPILIQGFLEQIFPTVLVEPIVGVFDQIILILWFTGVQILIFLAALQKISPSLYEAARIDGGSDWECFWKITLPTIKPIILVNLVYTLVSLANHSTNPMIELIVSSMFGSGRGYGYAAAMAWLYAFVIGALLLVIFLFFIEREDKRIRKIRKQNLRDQKKVHKARMTIERNNQKLERKLKKGADAAVEERRNHDDGF